MNLSSTNHPFASQRFVSCVQARGMLKPRLVRAYCAMIDSRVLIPPAVFRPGKPQASPHRVNLAPFPVKHINLKAVKFFEGKFRGKKSTQPRRKDAVNSAN